MRKNTYKPPFPKNLETKAKLKAAGITVTKMASILGLSRDIVNRAVNGRYKGISLIERIESHLDNLSK